jgi:uncharacterized protein (DUF2141 family)
MCILVLAAAYAGDSDSTVYEIGGVITNYSPGKPIHIALYSSEHNFKNQIFSKTLRFKANELPAESLHYAFEGVARGHYMIAAFQDFNNDKTMNKGLFGRPKEPYCLYRPYTGLFAPTFSKCKFRLDCDLDSAHLQF